MAPDTEVAPLAVFPRLNPETKVPEELRITSSEFNGKMVTHARIWWKSRPNSPDDDGWRPSKTGVFFREHELDKLITSLEVVREMVQEAGRPTNDDRDLPAPQARQGSPKRPNVQSDQRPPWKPPERRQGKYSSQPREPDLLDKAERDFDEFEDHSGD